jgi:hypothetical protein
MLSFRRLFSVVQSPQRLRAYLAGLWEGAGHIWTAKTTHAPSGKKYNPHFAITFTEYDYPLVRRLMAAVTPRVNRPPHSKMVG